MADRFLELFPFVIQFGISDDLEEKMEQDIFQVLVV